MKMRLFYTRHIHTDDMSAIAHAVCLTDLTYRYPGRTRAALEGVSLCIRQGERVALLGPNGAGKSTLLKIIAGLLHPPNPDMAQVFETNIDTCHPHTSFLAQRTDVDWRFPVTVRDVVMMGRYSHLGWFARPGREDDGAVDAALTQVGLSGLARRSIGDLSGGQQQRAFLARSLAQHARLLLLDEPFAGLDAPSQRSIMDLIRELQQQGMTVISSTHDLGSVVTGDVADRVILLNRHVVADGTPAEVMQPDVLREAYG
jgi:ABC-type Mn2+/Zn2+ transport system ATPase subunit